MRRFLIGSGVVALVLAGSVLAWRVARPPHNLLIFVADGLRYDAVDADTAPEMTRLKREGVDFTDSHALVPTLTTPNASAIATGRTPGDTGDFANSVYVGAPALPTAFLSLVPFLEDDPVLGAMNARFGGDYLGRPSLLSAARAAGFQTAAVGKLGPTAIQDVTARDGRGTLVVDDATGQAEGLPLPPDVLAAMRRAGMATAAPDRGLNTDPGTSTMPGVRVANVEQQDWFVRLATEVVLPRFKASRRPFVIIFWSRDPDGTQHNQGDSLNSLTPGINGPTTKAAIRNADSALGRLRAALRRLGLERTTDVVVTADHGFSVTSKASATSGAAKASYPDVPAGLLPPGFLALDLGRALDLPVWEPSGLPLGPTGHPRRASAVLGRNPRLPDVVIGANGGSDLIWLPTPAGRALAARIVDALTRQDYAGGLFAEDALGAFGGAIPSSRIGLKGSARTPAPQIVVAFRTGSTGCPRPALCGFEVADTELQQGQGIHGAFGRADTRNLMAAAGPDFRAGYSDPAPVGNVDWAPTLAHVLRLRGFDAPGGGRIMRESLRSGPPAREPRRARLVSAPAANGFRTVLDLESSQGRDYPTTAAHVFGAAR